MAQNQQSTGMDKNVNTPKKGQPVADRNDTREQKAQNRKPGMSQKENESDREGYMAGDKEKDFDTSDEDTSENFNTKGTENPRDQRL